MQTALVESFSAFSNGHSNVITFHLSDGEKVSCEPDNSDFIAIQKTFIDSQPEPFLIQCNDAFVAGTKASLELRTFVSVGEILAWGV